MDAGTRVEWPSSFATRLGVFMIIPPLLVAGFAITFGMSMLFHRRPHPGMPIAYGAVFLIAVVWAVVSRRRPALVLDGEGIVTPSEGRPVPWSDAARIWVGRDRFPGPFRGLVVVVWTQSALDYARRTGFRPDARLSLTHVATTLTVAEAAADLERFRPGVVRTQDEISLRHLNEQLRHAER